MATCLHPINVKGTLVPCGKCPVCRQNRRQSLATRFILEAAHCNGNVFFITLTYDDYHLNTCCIPNYNPPIVDIPNCPGPYGSYDFAFPDACFDKREVQLLIKRLRKKGFRFKYFFSCEYGSLFYRPHLHGILFFQDQRLSISYFQSVLEKEWGKGRIEVSYANDNRLAYCAKYALKDDFKTIARKLHKWDACKPWTLWSSRPGIGSSAINWLNEYIYNDGNYRYRIDYKGNSITLDAYFKKHVDPSLVEELKYHNYYDPEKFSEIQESLSSSLNSNQKKIKFGSSSIIVNSYEKDKEILAHRRRLTDMKRNLL